MIMMAVSTIKPSAITSEKRVSPLSVIPSNSSITNVIKRVRGIDSPAMSPSLRPRARNKISVISTVVCSPDCVSTFRSLRMN